MKTTLKYSRNGSEEFYIFVRESISAVGIENIIEKTRVKYGFSQVNGAGTVLEKQFHRAFPDNNCLRF